MAETITFVISGKSKRQVVWINNNIKQQPMRRSALAVTITSLLYISRRYKLAAGMVTALTYTSFGLVVLAMVIDFIAFVTPGWLGDSSAYAGLWRACMQGICVSINYESQGKAAQAMQCLALMAYATALATGIVLIVKKQQIFNVIMSVSVLLASGFAIIGVIVYGTMDGVQQLYYSYALCCLGAAVAIAAGVCGLVNIYNSQDK